MSTRKHLRESDEAETQEMLAERDPVQLALESFFAEGLIAEVLYPVKRGKEAMVYCCQAHTSTGWDLVAAKFYRPTEHRAFRNSAIYEEGRVIEKRRDRVAVQKKTRFGRQVHFNLWINHEYETLSALTRAGAHVPRPLARGDDAILMEYVGDVEGAAPSLMACTLSPAQARAAFESVMADVECCLAHNCIHGDLSAFNILCWRDQPILIDFPQAVDPRFNPHALALLTRDVERVCQYFARYGLSYNGRAIASHLWNQFTHARL